ncbi:hypothetical protein FGB62_169g218 [Gracilaria domingensis]|nr:hypothetical protein FGB62_169g218 [Gracilaria domingensis]
MSSCMLQAPVLEIQKKLKLKRQLPWGYVAASLVSLLRRYSTGLSLSVVCDEILAQHQSQRQGEECEQTHCRAIIVRVTKEPPEIWLIHLADGRYVAFYAHSKLFSRFKPGVSFSFPSNALGFSSCEDVQAEALAHARKALNSSPTSFATPKAADRALSPVDIAKLNHAPNSLVESPSSKSTSLIPTLSAVILPTPTVLVDLDSVPSNTLNLNEPIESFTLQRVWNERSLHPSYIFARVVEVNPKNKHIRIQDQSSDLSITQPSVLWLLHENQYSYADMVEEGCFVLLERPAVQPNGNSFFVIANECTTCYYRKFSSAAKTNLRSLPRATIIVPESPPRKRQRRRDPDLSQSQNPVDSRALTQLLEPHLQKEFVLVSVAERQPIIEDVHLAEVQCPNNVRIRIVGREMVKRCNSVSPGDQLLFEGVRWVAASTTLGSQTTAGWAASSFHNVSSLSSVLQSLSIGPVPVTG